MLRINSNRGLIIPMFLLILVCFTSSCVTQRHVEYLQDSDEGIKSFDEASMPDYRIKPNDELYILVSSFDDAAANIFTNTVQQQAFNSGIIQPYGASLMSYTIDREGFLLMPLVGRISVSDKTVTEISEIIKNALSNVLNQPVVSVKLVNRYVSVLGEVRVPGHYSYSQDKLSIYDAIGLAGDITDYGNRKNVILVRNEDGKNSRINLNLTSSDILASDYYNLRPNDIIYVKPLKNKFWGMREFPFTVIFSTITTGLLIYNVLQ